LTIWSSPITSANGSRAGIGAKSANLRICGRNRADGRPSRHVILRAESVILRRRVPSARYRQDLNKPYAEE
jgi:hypothetical protein